MVLSSSKNNNKKRNCKDSVFMFMYIIWIFKNLKRRNKVETLKYESPFWFSE